MARATRATRLYALVQAHYPYENVEQPQRKPRLHRTRAPASEQLTQLADKIAHRVSRHLARNGWLEGEHASAFLLRPLFQGTRQGNP